MAINNCKNNLRFWFYFGFSPWVEFYATNCGNQYDRSMIYFVFYGVEFRTRVWDEVNTFVVEKKIPAGIPPSVISRYPRRFVGFRASLLRNSSNWSKKIPLCPPFAKGEKKYPLLWKGLGRIFQSLFLPSITPNEVGVVLLWWPILLPQIQLRPLDYILLITGIDSRIGSVLFGPLNPYKNPERTEGNRTGQGASSKEKRRIRFQANVLIGIGLWVCNYHSTWC